MPATLPAPIVFRGFDATEMSQTEYWTALNSTFFCKCPNEYDIENYNGAYTVYFGRCNHRHGMNITGSMPKVEVDYPRLKALVEMANLGLKTIKDTLT